jgi:probable HAF family extracellular repeat protein
MKRAMTRWVAGSSALGALVLLSTTLEAGHRYNIATIDVPPGTPPDRIGGVSVRPRCVNDRGQVAGRGEPDPFSSSFSGSYAFRWDAGVIAVLGKPPCCAEFFPAGIDDGGRVVGGAPGNPDRALLWGSGEYQELGSDASAYGINHKGQVVLRIGSTAILWESGSVTQIGLPGGLQDPLAINELGQVVGSTYISLSPAATRGFLWDAGNLTLLETLPNPIDNQCRALGVNDRGQVVGFSYSASGVRAVLWEAGRVIDLGDIPFRNEVTIAEDINNLGQVIGWASGPTQHPLLWEGGQVFDLNDLIDQETGWVVQEPKDINNFGQIVGIGLLNGLKRGFLLTPVPGLHPFTRGDANGDGGYDVSDCIDVLLFLFGGLPSLCRDALDANDDGRIDLSDPIGLLAYLFNQGFPPPPPFGSCARDPTPDELTCEDFPCGG